MKKYELILQGNKTLIITQDQKEIIEKAIKFKTNDVLSISDNFIRLSSVKGIYPVKEEVIDNKEEWIRANNEWHFTCLKMSQKSVEDKTADEINNRILNGTKLEKIEIPETEMAVMYSQILDFFQKNTLYPRCPMSVWWSFIKDKIKSKNIFLNKYWVYVARNDEAVGKWVKFNKGNYPLMAGKI